MAQAVGIISKNVPGTYPKNQSFPLRFFFGICLVPQKQWEKESINAVSGFLHNHLLSCFCGISTFLKWVFMFWLFNKIFFSSRFCSCICGWECWLLPPKGPERIDLFVVRRLKNLWELRVSHVYAAVDLKLRTIWSLKCIFQSVGFL